MQRPRSIVGLVGYLVAIYAQRHRRAIAMIATLAATIWIGRLAIGDHAVRATAVPIQAAVLRDGFAVLEGTPADRHLITVDVDGQRRRRLAVPVIAPDARAAGTSSGPAVAWRDGTKVKLARVTGDGTLGEVSTWGRNVRAMCDGVATNEKRFAVAWLEKGGGIMFVHGPTGATTASELEVTSTGVGDAVAANITWCSIVSADEQVGLFWREGTRTFANFCTRKSCAGLFARVPIDPKAELVSIGCAKDGCALAFREGQGTGYLGWMTTTGKPMWKKELRNWTTGAPSITGAGPRALAVGYVATEGATTLRVTDTGLMERAWFDPGSSTTPSLAWARDRLFVAHHQGGTLVTEVLPLPR